MVKRTVWREVKDGMSSSDEEDSYRGWDSACCSPMTYSSTPTPNAYSNTSSMSVARDNYDQRLALARPSRELPGLTKGEKLLADEMNQLSLNEREVVFEDIHGVIPVKEETPELLQSSVKQLDDCLAALRKNREGYDKACFLNPAYGRRLELKVMFLRATQYNVTEAAARICEHYEIKLRLFGLERLARDIEWDDLQEDAKFSLESGAYQIYPDWKDRSGRVVSCDVWSKWRYKSAESQVQAMWWISMRCMRDMCEKNHHMGIVLIPFTLGVPSSSTSSYYLRAAALSKYKIGTCFPIRVSGFHGCFQSDGLRPLFSALMAVLPTAIRLRVKCHFGSYIECRYALSSFGIDASFIDSVESNDAFDLFAPTEQQKDAATVAISQGRSKLLANQLSKWKAAEIEQKEYKRRNEPDVIRFPLPADITLGRGVPFQRFPGNVALSKLLERDVQAYMQAKNRKEKNQLTENAMRHVAASGGRFLKRDDSGEFWAIVPKETARQKCAMGYRNLARRVREVGKDGGNSVSSATQSLNDSDHQLQQV